MGVVCRMMGGTVVLTRRPVRQSKRVIFISHVARQGHYQMICSNNWATQMICAQWRPVPQRPIDLADQAAQPGAGLAAASSACQVRLLMMIKKHAGMAWSPILPWK